MQWKSRGNGHDADNMQGTFESKNIYNMEYFIDQKTTRTVETEVEQLKEKPTFTGTLIVPLAAPGS